MRDTLIKNWFLALFLAIGLNSSVVASHMMGGEITWQCQGGGQYIFTLVIYRDCNGSGFTTAGINLTVWDHPTLTSIPMNFIGQTDISPTCNAVAGGPAQITCGTLGNGAVERYEFQSGLISITGVPPPTGWAFTYHNFSRNPTIDNLVTPNLYGLTLRALMFPFSATNTNPCFDSSPTFLETPSNVICSGTDFKLNHNANDPDGDSLVFEFAPALDTVSLSATSFSPPTNPAFIPYVGSYSFNSPTPGTSINPANIPATIDPVTGEISFNSVTLGNFVFVVKVSSYRCGQKISEVYRETQIIVVNCSGNNLPVINPPFGASFSTTVVAGQVVTFDLTAVDTDLLQDGSKQTITLTATGNQFGAAFTNPLAGCTFPPCATLNSTLPGSSTDSITRNFVWQTDCGHLINTSCGQTAKVYQFVFRASDDFCPAPGVSIATVSITVLPPPPVTAPSVHCADVALNGDVTLTWVPPADPAGQFVKYEIYNTTLGALVGTVPTIATNTFTHIGADAQNGSMSYCIKVYSGCTGTAITTSDTVSSMFLNVSNTGTGIAVLNWNKLFSPINSPTAYPYYDVWREFPIGTWTIIGTRPYGTETYKDTISICDDTLNYKVSVTDSTGCISFSSIDGDRFTDLFAPGAPVISYVTVDTATGLTQINWYPSGALDTEGYIILQFVSGSWIVIDTVYGIGNVSYVPPGSNPDGSSEQYGVAAFDTCWHGTPAAPNTSAMGTPHNTIFLTTQLIICDSSVNLNWTAYTGWPTGVGTYEIYASENGAPYVLIATVSGSTTTYLHSNLNRLSTYKYIINAISNGLGVNSISNISTKLIKEPSQPNYAYIQTVTVTSSNEVLMRFLPDVTANVLLHKVYRSDDNGSSFTQVGIMLPGAPPLVFTDNNVNTQMQSYVYKVITVDSCGKNAAISNEAKTIFLQAISNSVALSNSLNWNPYTVWDGGVSSYQVLRSVNNEPTFTVAGSTSSVFSNYDDVDVYDLTYTTGEFCYKIVGLENINPYGFAENSESNVVCVTIDPLVYVPNAFTPGGLNPIFKPIVSYVDYTNYEFEIYNRWGEVIFKTNDVNIGWDGYTSKGKVAKEDVYIYQLQFKTGGGKDVDVQGHVTLLDYEK